VNPGMPRYLDRENHLGGICEFLFKNPGVSVLRREPTYGVGNLPQCSDRAVSIGESCSTRILEWARNICWLAANAHDYTGGWRPLLKGSKDCVRLGPFEAGQNVGHKIPGLAGELRRQHPRYAWVTNGDRARFHRKRKQRFAKRERDRALKKRLIASGPRRPDGRNL